MQSLKFEHKLYASVKVKMEEMQQHNMSWIEVNIEPYNCPQDTNFINYLFIPGSILKEGCRYFMSMPTNSHVHLRVCLLLEEE
jgi:hypothetical protein